jgi:hypothetical protein
VRSQKGRTKMVVRDLRERMREERSVISSRRGLEGLMVVLVVVSASR